MAHIGGITRHLRRHVRAAQGPAAHATRAAEAERRLADAVRERAAADRASDAKTALLSHLSHELRTPLNSVLGYAQLLEDAELHDPDDRLSVARILEAGGQLLALLDEVLDLAHAVDAARRADGASTGSGLVGVAAASVPVGYGRAGGGDARTP
jgi:signal transduction histidine kinase